MPANLPPQYHAAEERYRTATAPEEKIRALREMLAVMPKHKGTEKLQADIKRRISQLQTQAKRGPAGARQAPAWVIERVGAGQVPVVGPPNAGKSSLVSALTAAEPKVAEYPFTTVAPLPGMMAYEDIQIQLIDTPPLTPEHWVDWMPELVRRADACVFVLDLSVPDPWAPLPTILERLADRGVVLGAAQDLELGTFDLAVPTLLVANKGDAPGAEARWEAVATKAEGRFPAERVSALHGDSLERLRRRIYETLAVLRVYAKPPGKPADKSAPFVLPRDSRVRDLAERIHKDVARSFRYARLWGRSGKFEGQRVGDDHTLEDGDVVEIHAG